MNPELRNLHNCTDHKTRRVITYLQSLNPHASWGPKKAEKFRQAINNALAKHTANEMLESIQYDYDKEPGIYKEIGREDIL